MDHATYHRQALIASASSQQTNDQAVDAAIQRYANDLEAKRIQAIKSLGDRWVFHPNYNPRANRHHNNGHKGSAVLSAFLHLSGAIAQGRV